MMRTFVYAAVLASALAVPSLAQAGGGPEPTADEQAAAEAAKASSGEAESAPALSAEEEAALDAQKAEDAAAMSADTPAQPAPDKPGA